MAKHKDIGKTFKEELSDFRKSPNAKVWDKIVADLDKKDEKKKPLVLWWKLGGIAVAILMLVGIGYKMITNKSMLNNQKIITKSKLLDSIENESNIITKVNNTHLIDTLQIDEITNSENIFVKNNNKGIKNKINKRSKNHQKKKVQFDELIVVNKNNDVIKLNKEITNNKVAFNNKSENKIDKKIIINNNISEQKTSIKTEVIEIVKNQEGKKEETKNELIAIEDALDIVNEKTKSKKEWEVSVKGAPILYSSLSGGSSITNELKNNTKTNDVTLSYGLSVSYPINKKIKIRTGFNAINLAYKTEQVSAVSILNAQSLTNTSLESFFVNDITELGNPLENRIDLTQEINYYEIPLELKYAILDKKLNIETIFGLSTLFLNNNSVIVNNETDLGSVNNLKEVSFTGNFGFGFNYKLTKKIQFNLEPSIKIQFNTYKDNVDYKPYFLGVYSGFSYKF